MRSYHMSIIMTLRIALKALNRNKIRTMRTMLGMIIGVGAVITMEALGKGAQTTIEEQVKAAGTLFGPDVDPTGELIRIRNQPFKVIGVMASKGQSAMGQDQDDTILVPYTTVMKKLQGQQNLNNITVSAASADQIQDVAESIRQTLRVRHKIMPGDADDFMVRTLEEMASVQTETTKTMTTLLASIAGVSLLVGGIGIMNIMLVSVTERTREIGLRMAIGARGKDVLLQFLVEAIVISLVGGAAGIGIGYLVS